MATPTPAPTSTPQAVAARDSVAQFEVAAPAVDVGYKTVSIMDGIMQLDVPDVLVNGTNNPIPEYEQYGYLNDEAGNAQYCRIFVTKVFKDQAPAFTYELAETLLEPVALNKHGVNTTFERFGSVDINTHDGFYTKFTYPAGLDTWNKYACFLHNDGIFYSISILARDGVVRQRVAEHVFDSIEIDVPNEKALVGDFAISVFDILDNMPVYMPSNGMLFTIHCPPDWNPTESMRLIDENHCFGVTYHDNTTSINATIVSKADTTIDSLEAFIFTKITEMANRGFIDGTDFESINMYVDEENRPIIVYPIEELFIAQYMYEYENHFICLEYQYLGNDQNIFDYGAYIASTFIAMDAVIGEEILPTE